MTTSILFAAVFLVTFLVTVLVSKKLIPVLKSKKMGQKILDIGPRWHKSKEGTPTMGGIAFIVAILLSGIAACVWIGVRDGIRAALPLAFTLALGLAGGLIGCVDDLAKLRKKQNEGLTAAQKFLLQLLAAGLYLLGMALVLGADTEVYFPFIDKSVDFGIFYYVVALLLITGVMNSVNLTDGLDGLCSGVTLVVGVFFTVAGLLTGLAEPEVVIARELPEDEIGSYWIMEDGTKEYLLFHTYDICMAWLGNPALCEGPERCYHK